MNRIFLFFKSQNRTSKGNFSSGFSMVEIMIALVLGLALTGVILSIFVNNKKSYDTNNRTIEVNGNLRFALSIIQNDIENAGFYGGLSSNDSIAPNINTNTDCLYTTDSITLSSATDMPVWGRQASNDPEATCLAGITAGTDYISIRGTRGTMTADASLDPSRIYVRAGKTEGEFIVAGSGSSIPNAANMNWKYYSSIYYICQNRLLRKNLIYSSASTWSLDVLIGPDLPEDTDGNPVCDSTAVHTEAGIENMQLLYAIDSGLPLVSGQPNYDGVADYYADGSSISKADWAKVVEVKISLLARSDIDNSFQDNDSSGNAKTYLLADQTITPLSINYHRSLITNTVFLHNTWYQLTNDPGKF